MDTQKICTYTHIMYIYIYTSFLRRQLCARQPAPQPTSWHCLHHSALCPALQFNVFSFPDVLRICAPRPAANILVKSSQHPVFPSHNWLWIFLDSRAPQTVCSLTIIPFVLFERSLMRPTVGSLLQNANKSGNHLVMARWWWS